LFYLVEKGEEAVKTGTELVKNRLRKVSSTEKENALFHRV
jgi:hypothetical protein